jgi:hypothetical protein
MKKHAYWCVKDVQALRMTSERLPLKTCSNHLPAMSLPEGLNFDTIADDESMVRRAVVFALVGGCATAPKSNLPDTITVKNSREIR